MRAEIQLVDGRYHHFIDELENTYDIRVLARALSRICRFTGHLKDSVPFYSVAEHCVRVSRLLPLSLKFQGLMHDVHEALIGDVSAPLKTLLPDYRALEKQVERRLRAAFNLPAEFHPEVRRADLTLLYCESYHLMANPFIPPEGFEMMHKVEDPIEPWPPAQAFYAFMLAFNRLNPGGLTL